MRSTFCYMLLLHVNCRDVSQWKVIVTTSAHMWFAAVH
jgi:hypothetical protein